MNLEDSLLAVSEVPRGICRCIELLPLFQQEKFMYTVKQKCILCTRGSLKSWERPTLHATHSCLFCMLIIALYRLEA